MYDADNSLILASADHNFPIDMADAKGVPVEYHLCLDLFSKALADKLPEHGTFDHRIHIETATL